MDSVNLFQRVLKAEAQALLDASEKITADQTNEIKRIFEYLTSLGGSLVVCGVGKSGLVGAKIASTFCSLGLPSFFLHPTEALHGDMGRIGKNDAILFLSKSGSTEEILKFIPFLDIPKELRISLLGNVESPIANESGVVLNCSVEREACLNDQAPTTSSTLALAMGDALAVFYEQLVGLSREGFASNHPGGLLGKSMRIQVKDLMWKIDDCPRVKADTAIKEVILEMTQKPVGACAVIDDGGKLLGLIVDGDIRRLFASSDSGLTSKVVDVMNKKPTTIAPTELAFTALKLMEERERPISLLPVTTEQNEFLGMVRIHDLWKEGLLLERS
jgi:arabinose-5-phosphate isomerase